MVDKQLQRRRKLYFNLSSKIAQIDNAHLHALLETSEMESGWGRNHAISLGQSRVFVKRVPVTDLEYENMFSTRNFYDLPTYYNYGFGSAGLGVFRELVTHIKTTNWVLEGSIATFPLMYHYRIIPFTGAHEEPDMERHARYIAYWGGNANIGRYMLDRAKANHELVLFLEYFPHTTSTWLLDHPARMPMIIADIRSTIAFLSSKGIIHLDSHFNNVVTDGKRAYLTDFGLVLDRHFELTAAERQFFRQNSYYDYGNLIFSLGAHLFRTYRALPDADKALISERIGIKDGAAHEEVTALLLKNFELLDASGSMKLEKRFAANLAKYRSISELMHNFYTTMRSNNRKNTTFDNVALQRLLKETGFVPGTVSNQISRKAGYNFL